jgi:hypothetical protein
MNYYWIASEQQTVQLDPALYQMWVDTDNPKKDYYTPIAPPPGPDYYYNGTAWVQYPPPPPPPLTRLGFMSRFTDAELVGIEVARQTAPDIQVRATLTVLKESWMAATIVDVTDPRTQQGVQLLVQMGLLAEARVPEILAPVTTSNT